MCDINFTFIHNHLYVIIYCVIFYGHGLCIDGVFMYTLEATNFQCMMMYGIYGLGCAGRRSKQSPNQALWIYDMAETASLFRNPGARMSTAFFELPKAAQI